jgi:hypothetical protein
MSRATFWDKWILAVAVGMSIFGVLMALFSGTAFFDGFNRRIDAAFWGGPAEPLLRQFQIWVYGVWGATVAGFGALAAFVAQRPFRLRRRWARDALAVSILLWFVLDTGLSMRYGVWFNVGFNALVAAALGLPLLLTWTSFPRD